jgi:vesicle coat complex subunit
MMKHKSLNVLHRYRQHLLEREQIALQDRIAEDNQQKARLLQLQSRVAATHDAKAKADSVEELCTLDDAAAYLHGRMTLARRAITITTQAREEALDRTLRTLRERDQIASLLEKQRAAARREDDEQERKQIDELVTARYATAQNEL